VKVKKALFKVVGMCCTTKRRRSSEKIDIDYMTDSVIVEFDPSMITKEEIKNRL
jgi:copper chaperone